MAGFAGRDIDFLWGGAAVLGVREKGIELNGEPINVTSDEDNGKRTLLTVSAEDEVNLSISGVTKSNALKSDWHAGTRTKAVIITYPNGDVLSGTFFMASFSETGPYNDATTFEMALQSTGAVTFTPYQ
jgi:predicted secreted protein